MKELGFMAVAAFVAGVFSRYLPSPPGMQQGLTLLATFAALVGAYLGRSSNVKTWNVFVVAAVCIATFVAGFLGYQYLLDGRPGLWAGYLVYFCSLLMFVPMGFIIEVLGIKITS